jgi:hypothetical protein
VAQLRHGLRRGYFRQEKEIKGGAFFLGGHEFCATQKKVN